MARIKVRYESIDPYYSTHEQAFIGVDLESCCRQKIDYEKWLGRNHPAGISCIFKPMTIEEKE